MGLDLLSLKAGSHAFEEAFERVMDSRVAPLVDDSIRQLSAEFTEVVAQAGDQVQRNIEMLSQEIHNHRSMTRDDIMQLIDYAATQFGAAIDQRVLAVKQEASQLINEKVELLKGELEEAAKLSRKTMYTNVAISVAAALCMAAVGLVYKKVSLGELDLLAVFRIALLSSATFSAVLSLLKAVQRWRGMRQAKKGVATVAIGYLGILRPNGALGLLALSALLMAGWVGLHVYTR
ncbi:hypothetical protein [Rugamonas sp.]|uniref:hypothetical protein n=1 Tax=Rugamonas sp. TaxID=1926287 RepID=UPI0025EBFB4B|nr:hypothetical protein [Rugamonas sp.]